MTITNNVTSAILHYLRSIGALAWRNNTGAFKGEYTTKSGDRRERFVRYGERGSGDIFALHRGQFYSIEVKTGKDKLRPEQVEWIAQVEHHGGLSIEARTVDDVIERIRP